MQEGEKLLFSRWYLSRCVHLQALLHVLRDDEAPEVKDNACSAVAWLIESCSSQIPLSQVELCNQSLRCPCPSYGSDCLRFSP